MHDISQQSSLIQGDTPPVHTDEHDEGEYIIAAGVGLVGRYAGRADAIAAARSTAMVERRWVAVWWQTRFGWPELVAVAKDDMVLALSVLSNRE